MAKWVAAFIGLVIVLGIMLYRLGQDEPELHVDVPANAQSPKAVAVEAEPKKIRPAKAQDVLKSEAIVEPATAKLDPTSDAFSDRIDVGIPDQFRAEMAACERNGVDPNAEITISYKLHIEEGVVSASKVNVEESNLNNADLELCMVSAVQDKRWLTKDMPNFEEEQDLFVRMRSLNKYLSPDDQKAVKERDNLEVKE